MSFLHLLALPALVSGLSGTKVIQTAKINEAFTLGGLRVRVLSVTNGLTSYRQKYDQREDRLTPGFRRDRLSVIELDAENPTSEPISLSMLVPSLVDREGSLTDHSQWDVRQRSFVRTTNPHWQTPQDVYSYTYDPVAVAPGGRVRFAILFSIHAAERGNRLRLEPGRTLVVSGITSPVTDPGPAVEVTLGD